MNRHDEIKNAYHALGKDATFYDGMITCSTLPGRAVCGLVWNMGREKNTRYLEKALSGIPEDFSGKMLEVPVGTGVLTMPLYLTLPRADVTCLDYSPDMMATAQQRAESAGLSNARFQQGDVGAMACFVCKKSPTTRTPPMTPTTNPTIPRKKPEPSDCKSRTGDNVL